MRIFSSAWFAAAAYLVLTIVMTWPVATGLVRDMPSDLGDPVFVAGILTWGSKHWLELFGGDLSAATRFWNAPFFYPEPLVTAYSEHFALHSLLTLPVYAATKNIILCYNLHFLATFALSGLGMYLFVRELTGRPLAAFVAGLAFAFAPYRFGTLAHLQVLSSQWMPFTLYGLRRYFVTRRARPLAGAALALWAQHLSSGYYMVFFGPFVALYALVEMTALRLMRNVKVWLQLLAAGAAVLAMTLPFALPYLLLRNRYHRVWTLRDIVAFSADVMGWFTASPLLKLWGRWQPFVKIEGYLFPGVTVVILAVVGAIYAWRSRRAGDSALQGIRAAGLFATIAIVLSFWLSLGPQVEVKTQPTGFPSLYVLAYKLLPGYDVARVPARFAMLTVFALAIAAGLGLSMVERRRPAVAALCGVLIVAEGFAIPLPRNNIWSSTPDQLVVPENRIYPESQVPEVYRYLATLRNAVIAHLPFGAPEREIQYVYYAAMHRKRIVNGYSGSFPSWYIARLGQMQNVERDPRGAVWRMSFDGVTHLVVHAGAWTGDRGQQIVAMFDRTPGFTRVARFGSDYVYRLEY